MRLFNWLWEKAERRAYEHILFIVKSRAEYHRVQTELAFYKKHEGKEDPLLRRSWPPNSFDAKEHGAAGWALHEVEKEIQKILHPEDRVEINQEILDDRLDRFFKEDIT